VSEEEEDKIETSATPYTKEELYEAFKECDECTEKLEEPQLPEPPKSMMRPSEILPKYNHKLDANLETLQIPQVQKDLLVINWKIEMMMERQEYMYDKFDNDFQGIMRELIDIKITVGVIKNDALQWIYRVVIFILALSAFLAGLERFLGM